MAGNGPIQCDALDCTSAAAFRFYDGALGSWRPLCERHVLGIHPSLEIHALLESGYLRPVEIEVPQGGPPRPPTARGQAFRAAVEELLDGSV